MRSCAPDVVVLDLGLLDIDGKEVITLVRRHADAPIIVLLARGEEGEKITALDLGADDTHIPPSRRRYCHPRWQLAAGFSRTLRRMIPRLSST